MRGYEAAVLVAVMQMAYVKMTAQMVAHSRSYCWVGHRGVLLPCCVCLFHCSQITAKEQKHHAANLFDPALLGTVYHEPLTKIDGWVDAVSADGAAPLPTCLTCLPWRHRVIVILLAPIRSISALLLRLKMWWTANIVTMVFVWLWDNHERHVRSSQVCLCPCGPYRSV